MSLYSPDFISDEYGDREWDRLIATSEVQAKFGII